MLIADMHNATELKRECIEYINDNAEEVIQGEGWKQLTQCRMELVLELYHNLVARK